MRVSLFRKYFNDLRVNTACFLLNDINNLRPNCKLGTWKFEHEFHAGDVVLIAPVSSQIPCKQGFFSRNLRDFARRRAHRAGHVPRPDLRLDSQCRIARRSLKIRRRSPCLRRLATSRRRMSLTRARGKICTRASAYFRSATMAATSCSAPELWHASVRMPPRSQRTADLIDDSIGDGKRGWLHDNRTSDHHLLRGAVQLHNHPVPHMVLLPSGASSALQRNRAHRRMAWIGGFEAPLMKASQSA